METSEAETERGLARRGGKGAQRWQKSVLPGGVSKTCSTVYPKAYYLVRVALFGLRGRYLQRSKFHIVVSMERDRDILLEG